MIAAMPAASQSYSSRVVAERQSSRRQAPFLYDFNYQKTAIHNFVIYRSRTKEINLYTTEAAC
jgi:hypothetical protein